MGPVGNNKTKSLTLTCSYSTAKSREMTRNKVMYEEKRQIALATLVPTFGSLANKCEKTAETIGIKIANIAYACAVI
ncbi:MAG: hypothetical protein QXV01_00705 [Candidatus Bathyarchaeia archaeon]